MGCATDPSQKNFMAVLLFFPKEAKGEALQGTREPSNGIPDETPIYRFSH